MQPFVGAYAQDISPDRSVDSVVHQCLAPRGSVAAREFLPLPAKSSSGMPVAVSKDKHSFPVARRRASSRAGCQQTRGCLDRRATRLNPNDSHCRPAATRAKPSQTRPVMA